MNEPEEPDNPYADAGVPLQRYRCARSVASALAVSGLTLASAWLLAHVAVAGATPAEAAIEVAEPEDYRQDDYRKPVPRTLKGARVIGTEEAEKLHAEGKAVFIDVYPRAPKPPNLPAGTLWRDPTHATVKGGSWLPNVGYGTLPPEDETYFRTRLEQLVSGDKAKPLVFYCLRDCWMSWNAAKRAMTYGYQTVIWYPEGTDGWQEAGNDIVSASPVP